MLNKKLLAAMVTGALFCGLTVKMSAKPADGPSDTQIVGIVISANNLDVEYAKIALAKSKNKAVREFAQRMVTDHSKVQLSVVALAEKLGVLAEDSPTRESLKSGGQDVFEKLNSLQGKEFDKYYIDNEVAYHKVVNGAVATVLIPSAQNPDLKAALQGVQGLFLEHGAHAERVQAATAK